jgi:ferrous iron transport protein B
MFLRRAGTIILAASVLLWALATYPKDAGRASPVAEAGVAAPSAAPSSAPGSPLAATSAAEQERQLANSFLGRVGRALEPAVEPLGYDWKIGVSMVASFAAREVFVSTMGTIYGVGGADEDATALGERLREERDPVSGAVRYTPLVAIGLVVFYVFALMCTSTIAVTIRETGGGWTGIRWAALQFGYMLALAYGGAWLVYHAGRALGWG